MSRGRGGRRGGRGPGGAGGGVRLGTGALAFASAALLLGCAPEPVGDIGQPAVMTPEEVFAGVPDDLEPSPSGTPSADPLVAWVDDGERLAVVTWGSSSCPAAISGLTVTSEQRMAVDFEPHPAGACTDDLAPTTHLFARPDGLGDPPFEVVLRAADGSESRVALDR